VGPERWLVAVAVSLLFFASIVLHELGHSLTAIGFGVRARSITLFVFGGLASLDSEPRRPRDEVAIAIAGPLVSAALGGLFLSLAGLLGQAIGEGLLSRGIAWLGRINLTLAVFNALPGFPLDGGRVLRGLVWSATGSFERATRVAAGCGAFFAYTLIMLGALFALLGGQVVAGLWLAFIGWFLLSAARATAGQVVLERILERVRVADVAQRVDASLLSGSETVAEIAQEAVMQRGLRSFYLIDGAGQLIGLVTLRELAATPPERRTLTTVFEVMVPRDRLAVVGPGDSGWVALRRMAERGVNQLPVVQQGRLLAAVTRERLLDLVRSELALEGQRGRV
jgi:Zn-dependent protease